MKMGQISLSPFTISTQVYIHPYNFLKFLHKGKKLKPTRYDISSINVKKKRSPSKHKVVRDPNRTQGYIFMTKMGQMKTQPTDVLLNLIPSVSHLMVYIIKANNGNEVDGSVSLMNVEAQAEQMALVASTSGSKRREHTESLSLTVVPKKPRTSRIRDSRVLEYSRPLNPTFQDVKTFRDFKIIYRGLCIDNELSEDMRSSYYRLCFQKKQFLHDGLPEGLCTKLVVGMIGETVSIAAKIKNNKLTTTKKELEKWNSILNAFELLGMKVGFLRDKIHLLATFLFESEAAPDIQSYAKVEEKLKVLKETAKKCVKVLDSLRHKVETYENIFKEVVGGPW